MSTAIDRMATHLAEQEAKGETESTRWKAGFKAGVIYSCRCPTPGAVEMIAMLAKPEAPKPGEGEG